MVLTRGLGIAAAVAIGSMAYGCGGKKSGSGATSGAGGDQGPTAVSTGQQTSTNGSSTSGPAGTGGSSSTGMMITCKPGYSTVMGECDLLQQNCPAGSHCDVQNSGNGFSTKCLSNDGTTGVKDKGTECTTASECKPGLSCVKDSDVSHCSPFCCPDNDQPCGAGKCDVQLNYDMNNMFHAEVCSYLPVCHLFKEECKNSTQCHLIDPNSCLAVCDNPSAMQVKEGGKCMFRNDCGESQFCNTAAPDGNGTTGTCRDFCDLVNFAKLQPDQGGCPPMRKCSPIQAPGCMNLGFCAPM